jgi:integrase
LSGGRHRLKTTQLSTKQPGIISDGDGLYLRTTASKSSGLTRSWVFVYHTSGKRRELGLGAFGAGTRPVTLAIARLRAQEAREMLVSGIDPIEAKRRAQGVKSFGNVADDFLNAKRPGWSNKNHVRQWERSLTEVCASIRPKAVDKVDTEDVLSILRPIWTETPEVGRRVRLRIEAVLDFARAMGLRTGDNPARGKGHILNLLAAHDRTKKHLAALPYADLPAFWKRLVEAPGAGAVAVRFTILTAARSGETRGATWGEIDLKGKLWTIPAERMKEPRDHRVPLTEAAMEVLRSVLPENAGPDDLVFAGQKKGATLSDMSLTAVLRRMSVPATVHGFRSTFRDWVAEQTDYSGEVAEAALSHAVGDATERAYRRGDALAKRRALMQDWAAYCASAPNG